MKLLRIAMLAACVLSGGVCFADHAKLDPLQSYGPDPVLPEPTHDPIPNLKPAPAIGWPAGMKPTAAAGLVVNALVGGLDHPRWLYVLPNGDVLVAETNAPPKPEDEKGIKGVVMKHLYKKAGSATPSADRITLLREGNGNSAPTRTLFISGLHSPFGMVLVGHDFYVADSDAVLRFPYEDGQTTIADKGSKLTDLPAGPINHHWTKNLIASDDGSKLYVTVGSNSNAGENGPAAEADRARVLEVDRATGTSRPFATGLRNPNGLAWNPQTHALWTTVNERDNLGSDLVPDYMTALKDGAFYGFPYSYYGQHVDQRVQPPRPDLVAKAIKPDYALGTHTASLGLAFDTGALLGTHYRDGAFVGQHGSWNRIPPNGYQVVFIPFVNGQPSGMPEQVLTGFLDDQGRAMGRPVGVAIDKQGALLVADDVGNFIWRVTPAGR